jgi:hypothetical protein
MKSRSLLSRAVSFERVLAASLAGVIVLFSTSGCLFLQGFEDHSRFAIQPPILAYALNGRLDMVKQYIEAGGDPNAVDEAGNTPLMMAVVMDHVEVVEYLLGHHADPWRKNRVGETALDIARRGEEKRSTKILEIYLKRHPRMPGRLSGIVSE